MLTYQHIPTIKGVAMTKPCWGPHTKVAFGPKWLPINKPVLRSCLCCFVCVFRESDFIQRFFDGGVVVVDPFWYQICHQLNSTNMWGNICDVYFVEPSKQANISSSPGHPPSQDASGKWRFYRGFPILPVGDVARARGGLHPKTNDSKCHTFISRTRENSRNGMMQSPLRKQFRFT